MWSIRSRTREVKVESKQRSIALHDESRVLMGSGPGLHRPPRGVTEPVIARQAGVLHLGLKLRGHPRGV